MKEFHKRVFAIAFTDSVHSLQMIDASKRTHMFFADVSISHSNWRAFNLCVLRLSWPCSLTSISKLYTNHNHMTYMGAVIQFHFNNNHKTESRHYHL